MEEHAMRYTLCTLVACLGMVVAGCSDGGGNGVSAPEVAAAPGAPRWNVYNSSNSGEYICNMTVTPSSTSVQVGSNAYFTVYRQICSRSNGQYLYTDTQGTYWSSSNTNVARVGGAGNSATMNLTATTHAAGTATISAIAQCCTLNYTGWTVGATLTVNPPPLDVSISGHSDVSAHSMCNLDYSAGVTGGTGPYTYDWATSGTIKADNDNSIVAAFATEGMHWVNVTVTDGNNTQDGAGMWVSATYEGGACNP
jgi:hypothetical protein